MSNLFKKGDRVTVVDEAIEGIVLKVKPHEIVVETKDGFLLDFKPGELLPIASDNELKFLSNFPIEKVLHEKEPLQKKKSISFKRDKNVPAFEVDLHINQLVKSSKGMDNFDILTLQLDTAKHKLDFAIQKKIQKIVFIHGVGEGVLKTELEYLLKKYDNVKFYDADYQKYGKGATEVYIFQNPKQDINSQYL